MLWLQGLMEQQHAAHAELMGTARAKLQDQMEAETQKRLNAEAVTADAHRRLVQRPKTLISARVAHLLSSHSNSSMLCQMSRGPTI